MMPAIHAVDTALHFGMLGAATPANQRAAERLLGAVADSLLGLEAALSCPAGAALITSTVVGMQLCAAGGVVSACARMAHAMQLSAPTLHRLAAALLLFTGPARMALVSALGLVRRPEPPSPDARGFLALLARSQVEAVNDLLQAMVSLPNEDAELEQLDGQWPAPVAFSRWLSAVSDAFLTVGGRVDTDGPGPDGHPDERDELAHYADVCCLMMLPYGHDRAVRMPRVQAAVRSDAALCSKVVQLLLEQALPAAARRAGMLPLPGGAQLPSGRPNVTDWRFLNSVVALLVQTDCLEAPREQCYRAQDQQMMQLALNLVSGTPAACPPCQRLPAHWLLWMFLGSLLVTGRQSLATCECCRRGRGRAPTDDELAAVAWRLVELVPKLAAVTREAAEAAVLSGGSDSEEGHSGSGGSASRSGAPQQQQRQQRQQQQQQQQEEAERRMDGFNHTVVYTLCLSWAQALQLASSAGEARSVQDAAAYCAAADAGLRLLPLLMQRHEDMQQRIAAMGSSRGSTRGANASRPDSHSTHSMHSMHNTHGSGDVDVTAALTNSAIPIEEAYSGLAEMLVVRVFKDKGDSVLAYVQVRAQASERLPPDVLALIPALHRLAATAARLLCWASGTAQAVRGLPGVLAKWERLVLPASAVLQLLHELAQHQGQLFSEAGDEEASERMHNSLLPTMAAFGQALLLVGPHLTPERLQRQPVNRHLLMPFIASASVVMAHHSPTRLASQLCPMLHSALEQLVADPPKASGALAFSVAPAAADSAQFSAELVRCGSLPLLFDLQAAGLRGVPEQAAMLRLGLFVECMAAIAARLVTTAQTMAASAARNGASSGSDSGMDSSGGASANGSGGSSDTAAAAQLRRAVAGVSNLPGVLRSSFEMMQQTASADPRGGDPRLMCVALGQLWVENGPQQRLEQLVAALQAAWSQPAALEREQVEIAEVAAVGRCAYLGCSNLGGEGGMAAGEGVGSKRCSGCRTAWYCGTACSHADWRQGGHKRACKALAAAWQRRKGQMEEETRM